MICEVNLEAMTASLGDAGVPGLTPGESGTLVSEVFILESELVLLCVRSFLGRGGGVGGTSGYSLVQSKAS